MTEALIAFALVIGLSFFGIRIASASLLFLAGIIPGLLLILSFLAVIGIWVQVKGDIAPPLKPGEGPEGDWRALLSVVPVLGLFLLVLGGIYGRVFPPTEASGIGAVGAALIALMRGHLWNLRAWVEALTEAVSTTASLIMVLFGALVFLQYINLTGIPFDLLFWVEDMNLSPFMLVMMVVAIALVMGTVFEAIGILLLLVPVFLPALEAAGVDLIWFGIIVVLVIEMGLITPPIGMNVFVVRSIQKDIEIQKIFLGVLPFIAAMAVVLVLLLAFPGLLQVVL